MKGKQLRNSLIIIFFSVIFIISSGISCEKFITAPAIDLPGRRDYVWTADTISLKYDMLRLNRLWGSSPQDIWAIGFGSSNSLLVWHYDGKMWRTDSANRIPGPEAIYGFAGNDVWVGCGASSMWKYDGRNWYKHSTYSYPGYDQTDISDLWGISPTNIYGVGALVNTANQQCKPAMIHYNGSKWEYLPTPDSMFTGYMEIAIQKNSGLIFIYGMKQKPGFTDKLIVYDGTSFTEIYSSRKITGYLDASDDDVYISIGQKIYKYINGKLQVWKDFTGTKFFARVWARREMDFFCGNTDGLGHYNGSDFQTIYQTNLDIFDASIFEKDVFFLARDHVQNSSVIIHGKLKENQQR